MQYFNFCSNKRNEVALSFALFFRFNSKLSTLARFEVEEEEEEKEEEEEEEE
jgi:hypothetical protein